VVIVIFMLCEWKRRDQRYNGKAKSEEKSKEFHGDNLKSVRKVMDMSLI